MSADGRRGSPLSPVQGMLSKCANPSCSASFRYFHQGQLFRMEVELPEEDRNTVDGDAARVSRRAEFFWLCDRCACEMTLACDGRGAVLVTRSRRDLREAS